MKLIKVLNILILVTALNIVQGQEVKLGPHSLESHGYLRTGLGRSLEGGEMVQFQAPGAMVKPRFGNEANHYFELQFDYKYQPEGREDSYQIVYMIADYLAYASNDLAQEIDPKTTQLYFSWNKIYKDMNVWIGRRYYQRENIDILDWFWLNSAQQADIGAGLENISLPKNQNLNIAILRFSEDFDKTIADDGLIEDYKLDVRWKEIGLTPNLKLNVLSQLGYRPEQENSNTDNQTGYTIGAWTKFTKGNFYNRTSAFYRTGINMVRNPYTGRGFLAYNVDGVQNYDLDNASDIQLTTDFLFDDKSENGFLGAVTYHHKDFGTKTSDGNDKTMNHFNVTGRYSRYLSNRMSLTFDTGYDYVNHTDGKKGGVFKATFSPEINWEKGMFSRPTIRPFITYATWSKDLMGEVGLFNNNDVYKDKTSGFTAGLQLEIWW